MASAPSPNGSNGRGGIGGRFAPGNPGGPGNPHAATVARFRSLVLQSITEDDLRAVVRKLVASAKAGERWAIRELLDRTVGKGVQPVEVEASGEPDLMDLSDDGIITFCIENNLIDTLPPAFLSRAVSRGLIDPEHSAQALEIQHRRDAFRREVQASKSSQGMGPTDRKLTVGIGPASVRY